jgi:hypothetical protein
MGLWVYNASRDVNNASNYPVIVGVSITLCALMVYVVATRLYVRIKMVKSMGADDSVIVAAAVSCAPQMAPRWYADISGIRSAV